MNTYEMVSIIDVDREDDGELSRAEETISREIVKAGGEVIDIGGMGQRKLAYAIEDHTEGLYLLSHFLLPPEATVDLRDNLKLNSTVIRNLIVRYKERPTIEIETREPEESAVESTEAEIMDIPTGDDIDDDISIITSEKTESFEDLKLDVNLDSIPFEDNTGKEPKEV